MNVDLALQITLVAALTALVVAGGLCLLVVRWVRGVLRREMGPAFPVGRANPSCDPGFFLTPTDADIRSIVRRPGLTLLEMIVVIAIISVLVTIVTAMGQSMLRQAAIRETQTILVSLDRATAHYKTDTGLHPWGDAGLSVDLFPHNWSDPDARWAKWGRARDPLRVDSVRMLTVAGAIKTYFDAPPPALRDTDPYAVGPVWTTAGHTVVWDAFGMGIHPDWDRSDANVRANQFAPVWHSAGPNQGSAVDDIYSSCFAM